MESGDLTKKLIKNHLRVIRKYVVVTAYVQMVQLGVEIALLGLVIYLLVNVLSGETLLIKLGR